jgi:hypothetical protein
VPGSLVDPTTAPRRITVNHRPRPLLASTIGVAIAALIALAAPAPAFGWGERQATRSCGTNWITSYPVSGGGRAATQELRGTCTGNLYAGLRTASVYARWGAPHASYVTVTFAGTWVGGTHRGCYECSASLT